MRQSKASLTEKNRMQYSLRVLIVTCCALVTVRECEAQPADFPAWTQHQVVGPLNWPEELVGKVQDEDKMPLPNAQVTLVIHAQVWIAGGIYSKPLHTAKTVTDEEGRFRFSTEGFPEIRHRPVDAVVTASASGLVSWQTWWWYGMEDSEGESKFGTVTLRRGKTVRGRCVDENGSPVANATLKCSHRGNVRGGWGAKRLQTEEDGTFEFIAPNFGEIGIFAYGNEHGLGYCHPEPNNQKNLEIKLTRGDQLVGIAKSAEGKPIRDAIVAAVSVNDGAVSGLSAPFQIATRTDAQGRFLLPPLSGKFRVYLTSASAGLVDGSHWESPEPVPLMVPVTVDMGKAAIDGMILRADQVATVSGTVTFPDGKPAKASTVKVYQMPEGNGVGFNLGQSVTDENGKYSIRIPVPLERCLITVNGRRYNGKYVRVESKNFDRELDPNDRNVHGGKITGDVSVDFSFAE